jgi:nitrilase
MKVRVSLVQDSPIFFDKIRTIDKIEKIVQGIRSEDPQIIVFPESFIPGYPRGFSFGTVVGSRSPSGRKLYAQYYEQSIELESPELKRLESIAKESNSYLIIGVTEKMEQHGSLYCSMLYISPSHGLLGVHRKIKPTGQERVIWAEDNGQSLVSFDTKIGKLGGLICWENYMPLARMAMYQKGVEIYIAPTADSRDNWTATMKHIALEGRCFVLGCNQYFEKLMYPSEYQNLVVSDDNIICRGGSLIVNPLGQVLAGPLFDQTGIITAEIDLSEIVKGKLDFDPIGHYGRPDIFDFKVVNQPEIKSES